MSEKDFEKLIKEPFFELLPTYDESADEIYWQVASIASFDTKEEAKEFRQFLINRIYS